MDGNDVKPENIAAVGARGFDLVLGALGKIRNQPAAATAANSRFERRSLIGEGGLGRVWLAYDRRLEREVALKELRPEKACNERGRRRFFREARIASHLRHPAIIAILDVEDDPPGEAPFFTMPVAPGGTLERSIAELHALPTGAEKKAVQRRLLQSFVTVCQAIDYAHSRGVLHRDLKPANIALGEFGEVLVLDWGLGRLMSQPEAEDTAFDVFAPESDDATLTQYGDILGTPAFMAPEQAAGTLDAVTARSDVYSLGVILFNILTNETPHQRYVGTREDFLKELLRRSAPPVRTIARQVSRALEAIGAKALAIEPKARYATAGELAADVNRWLAGEPVAVYREPWTTRVARWAKRHRTAAQILLGVAAIVLVASVTFGVSVWTSFDEMLDDHVKDQSLLAGEVAARMIDVILFHRLSVSYLGEKPDVKRLLEYHRDGRDPPPEIARELTADLVALMTSRPYWTALRVCDRNGRELLTIRRDEPGYGPVSLAAPNLAEAGELVRCIRLAESAPVGSAHMLPPRIWTGGAGSNSAPRREHWFCRSVRSPADGSIIGAIIASVGIFSPERPLYDFVDRRPLPDARVYLADDAGNLALQPAHHDDWHDDWLKPGLIAARFPELAPMFTTDAAPDSMSVPRSSTNQIVTAAQANYDPLEPGQRFVVVVVSSYDDLKVQEAHAVSGVWLPVAAVTAAVVVIVFFGSWLATRAADA